MSQTWQLLALKTCGIQTACTTMVKSGGSFIANGMDCHSHTKLSMSRVKIPLVILRQLQNGWGAMTSHEASYFGRCTLILQIEVFFTCSSLNAAWNNATPRKRYTGRAARFDWACKNADSVLFVRTGVASRGEVCDLLLETQVGRKAK